VKHSVLELEVTHKSIKMSFLQPFNFTSFGSFGGSTGNAFTQTTNYGPSRFGSFNTVQNNLSPQPLPYQQNLQVPESISSRSDYYGNPPEQGQYYRSSINNPPQPQQQQQTQEYSTAYQQHPAQSQQPIVTTPTRKRRPKKVTPRNVYVPSNTRVAPILGPIYAKDGYVPVVPLYSYPSVNNGTLYQIPILWTALSVALGLEVRGEILRGLPCIKRLNQLYLSNGREYLSFRQH